MTIRVRISNEEYSNTKIIGVSEHPFGGESRSIFQAQVPGGSFVDVYVHSGQWIKIVEVQNG